LKDVKIRFYPFIYKLVIRFFSINLKDIEVGLDPFMYTWVTISYVCLENNYKLMKFLF
jgi:hypothetical protein